MPRPLRLAFAGTPQFAVAALDALSGSGHEVLAVFTQPDRPAGRGRTLQAGAVKSRAVQLGLPVHQPASCKGPEVEAVLRELRPDVFVVVAYGLILPSNVLNVPRFGCLNIHASLLPRWRGAAPIQRALQAGDAVTGITIMRMEAGLDTGPMLAARSVNIEPTDTAQTLHDRLANLGGGLIVEVLNDLSEGPVREIPQPAVGVTYAEKLSKAEAAIDWGEDAGRIGRQVRAFNPWPIAHTRLNGGQVRIWEAEVLSDEAAAAQGVYGPPAATGQAATPRPPAGTVRVGSAGAARANGPGAAPGGAATLDVICGRGALRIRRLQLAGRNPLAAEDFLKAQPLTGARFSGP